MSTSWAHVVVPVVETEVEREASKPSPWRHRCRMARKCEGRTAYLVMWRYVTGRRGNVSTREVTACAAHAESFARKHGVQWPPTIAPVGLWGERIADELLRGMRESLGGVGPQREETR